MASTWPPDDPLTLLTEGEVTLVGRMPWSSNATFLVELCHEGVEAQAVYKPVRGERPLWDFPSGLHQREVAAYVLSEALGWGIVPPTVLRDDGPLGEGSLQLFVPADFEQHYFTLYDRVETHPALMTIARSTSSSTTPTARAATACSASTDASTRSTTACASRRSRSCAP